jgi:hypothetical protein
VREVWLRTNRRALLLVAFVPALMVVGGLALMTSFWSGEPRWPFWLGAVLVVLPAILCGLLFWQLGRPRLAFQNDALYVALGTAAPYRVPIEHVEVFFLGQGPTMLQGMPEDRFSTSNIVVRLAESAQAWKQRPVHPLLGHWCEGYIIIRGTWCEPITPQRMRELNQRLLQVHRQRRNRQEKKPS